MIASDSTSDYKAFYFTSLVQLLSDEQLKSPNENGGHRIPVLPHSKKPSTKVSSILSFWNQVIIDKVVLCDNSILMYLTEI